MSKRLILSASALLKLESERYHYPCPIVLKRINALLLKSTTSYSNKKVALLVGCHYNLVPQWVKLYESFGFEGISTVRYGTNKSDLAAHSSSIVSHFTTNPPRSIAEAMLAIKKLTGIERSESRVRVFLKKHGFSFKKRVTYLPKPILLLKKTG